MATCYEVREIKNNKNVVLLGPKSSCETYCDRSNLTMGYTCFEVVPSNEPPRAMRERRESFAND